MAEQMFIRLTENAGDATWIVLDQAGHCVTPMMQGPLAEARTQTPGRRVNVLVPGMHVITTRTVLPVKSPARLRQMLPYSLEEILAQDVEQLFFAAGPRTESGEVPVSIVARERLDEWQQRLREAGIEPQAMYAENDGVPDTPGTLTLILEGERAYGRRPNHAPFVFEGLPLPQLLDVLRGEDSAAADLQHVLVYADEAGLANHKPELAALQNTSQSLDVSLLEDGPLAHFAATLVAQPGTNLCQGSYAPTSDWMGLLRPWRLAASLLVGLILVSLLSRGAEYLSLARADEALGQRLEESCRGSFSLPATANCRAEVQRRLTAAGDAPANVDGGLLGALIAVAEARDPASRITALSYRNGVLDVRVTAPSVPAIDEFARRMTESERFAVEIRSANPADEGVEGQLQIAGAQP